MVITVGQDKISAKRDLRNIFPKEFSNRLLINEFITYVMNNFFEKSNEKLVSGFVGEVVPSVDGTECYIKEPTTERQMNQIIPVLTAGDETITYNNFIADLHNEGTKIYDENKLMASKHWSWCPSINVDMFINSNNYYWIGWDSNEKNTKVLTGNIDVSKLIGQSKPLYYEIDEEGHEILDTEYEFRNGDRVVFTNDTSKTYNSIPYIVSGLTYKYVDGEYINDEKGYFKLLAVKMPLIVLSANTNIVTDILGKENYTYNDETHEMTFKLINGMRLMFINDTNSEYNNKIYMVNGVGSSINLIEDSYDPYESLYDKVKDADYIYDEEIRKEVTESKEKSDYKKIISKPDYFIMERGCVDGNDWSIRNRWIHRTALEQFNVGSIETTTDGEGLQHGYMPILCFNKNMELYNYGTFDRGYIDLIVNNYYPTDLSNIYKSTFEQKLGGVIAYDGMTLLFTNISGSNPIQLYTVSIIITASGVEKVILKIKTNGQMIDGKVSDGSTVKGDVVKLMKDTYNIPYYFDGYTWKEGQTKNSPNKSKALYAGINQSPLFNLYDSDKNTLDNTVIYPQSTFEGCAVFNYKENTSEDRILDPILDRYVVLGDADKNYIFTNDITKDVIKYTPLNDYEQTIEGYKFFKIITTDEYLNDWYLSSSKLNQYIKTMFEANDETLFVTKNDEEYYKLTLKYKPSETSDKASLLVYKNGSYIKPSEMIIDNYDVYVKDTKTNDTFIVYLLTDENIQYLDKNYVYEIPLSLTVNQFNEEIETIGYNNCFDQMINIMENQKGFDGDANGSNNYSSLNADLSVGTKIVQHSSNIIRTMVLDNNPNTSIRGCIEYVENAYTKFKTKFTNLLNQYYIKGLITDDEEYTLEELDSVIKEIIEKINIGKEGLMPFYNNGILHLLENAYIPSTPAYLGVANCYEPRIEKFTAYTTDEKPNVLVGHDGSLMKVFGNVKDEFMKRLETLIYDSINSKFKDTKCGLDKFDFMPGFFRNNTYTRDEVIDNYSNFVETWANNNNLDYTEHMIFEYDTVAHPTAWKTWNYSNTYTPNGDELHGSYKSVYMYYYDTYRPDTHPWEMFGFGDRPSWWITHYGEAPYTSSNIIMWQDIENGYIRDGEYAGYYEGLKRPGLINLYMPVDENGELKSPMEIGLITTTPTIQNARARWKIGDIGEVEFAYLQTSASKYTDQIVQYLLRPAEWVEQNWDTVNNVTLFKNTTYEQTINNLTKSREDLRKMVLHNEYIDGSYIQRIGIQQWISDYVTYNNTSISSVADKIRNTEINLGYRCAGFYQKDTYSVTTDSYGELPLENIHMQLFKSKDDGNLTYSAMRIEKTKKGYKLFGFDKSYPYFTVRKPEVNGKKSPLEINGLSVNYYINWMDDVEIVPYGKEYSSIQDVYTIINGYGKYLEENENWYFNTRNASGVVSNFRTSSESFVTWATSMKGEESIGNVILLNPGVLGVGNYNDGTVEDLGLLNCGYNTVLDIYGSPIESTNLNVFRQTYNTFIQPKDSNIGMVKLRTYKLEHLITVDNKTLYGDILYEPKYYTILGRFNLAGVKVKDWYGTVYAPGYLLTDDGAIPNFDKYAGDLQYMFNTDDVHCQGDYATYSRDIVGYKKNKTYKELFKNDKAMFDFYKGAIKEKGTATVIDKMNRSTYVSSTGNNIELYENWLFKAGEFGHTSDNSVLEFILDTDKMKQNPQLITFESSNDYYYDENTIYNKGDITIYYNNEYLCLYDDTTGVFDENNWKKIRYVGNYIIFNNDGKWIKKQKNVLLNCFTYSDNLLVNPIGGFAQITDVEYIVADEDEFNEKKDSLSVGETIWVVKTNNGDFDIRKKTGVNKFVSMRYATLEDAYLQEAYNYVYHFKDDKKDYYTTTNSEYIDDDNLTPIYSDIDINDYTCRWCDIGTPEYTGEKGQYVNGTDYKIKLYNTVFKTMVDEEHVNNNTTIRDLDNDTSLTYSNLLLNSTEFGVQYYKYKWLFSINIVTNSKDLLININGQEYKDTNYVDLIVCEGDTIEWKAGAYCCGSRSGLIYIPPVAHQSDITTVSSFPQNPYENQQIKLTSNNKYYAYSRKYGWIELGTTYTSRKLSLTVPLSFRDGAVLVDKQTPVTNEEIRISDAGDYEFKLVGAGGGAGGGGAYRHRVSHGLHRRSVTVYVGGCAAASGVYWHGKIRLNNNQVTSAQNKYYLSIGAGGLGGVFGTHGKSGDDTTFYNNDTRLFYGQAGAGGAKAFNGGNVTVSGRKLGYGGSLPKTYPNGYTITVYDDCKNGNNGCYGSYQGKIGKSVFVGTQCGQGGTWVTGGTGKPGQNGYTKIVYRAVAGMYDDYSTLQQPASVDPISVELGESDSLDYTSYYQPFVLPSTTSGVTYFYSYDTLVKNDTRKDANTITSSSKFYKNRSKTITAYHKQSVIKNLWNESMATNYVVGDMVTTDLIGTVRHSGQRKYYICKYNHTSVPQNFELTRDITEQGTTTTVTLWEEYAPTYYYKINYNNGIGNTNPNVTVSGVKYNTELYEDANCTIRVTKGNGTSVTDSFMYCDDLVLDDSRPKTIGMSYTLVDQFATYSQLKPIYISEPIWGNINEVGTYDISSGSITYYEKLDNQSTIDNIEALVYEDNTCLTPIQMVDTEMVNDTLTYRLVDMKYVDLTDTVSDHHETSYEMKDKETYLYTSKTVSEIELDTPVYSEFELENEIGVYGDYIPQWEKITYTPNTYTNSIDYIKYIETVASASADTKTYTIKFYNSNNVSTRKEVELYYLEYGSTNTVHKFYTPSMVDTNGKLIYQDTTNPSGNKLLMIPLYYINLPEDVYDTYNDLPAITSSMNGKIYKTLREVITGGYKDSIKYYKVVDNAWVYVGDSTSILSNTTNFTLYTSNISSVYVDIMTNTSTMYAESNFKDSVVNQGSVLYNDNINSSVKMYFNKQGVGQYTYSNNLVSETDTTESINIMFTDLNVDPMYNALTEIDSTFEISDTIEQKIVKIKNGVNSSRYNSIKSYLDVNEVLEYYKSVGYTDAHLIYARSGMKEHVCKIYNMYRNININGVNTKVYDKLYMFGSQLYTAKTILDPILGDKKFIGVKYGTIEYTSTTTFNTLTASLDSLSTYYTVYETYSTSKTYNVGDKCTYNGIKYICIIQTSGAFNTYHWAEYSITEDKIVNYIVYKEDGDFVYITNDSYYLKNKYSRNILSDTDNVIRIDGTYGNPSDEKLKSKKGWMKIKYLDKEYMFNLISAERQRIATNNIKSCYLVDNSNDATMVKVQVYDPIQNIIPNNVLDEVNYISSSDPVNDYEDVGKWNDNKVGYLWWDTSKVRYVDYYQGDYEYRRNTWGKQLPGSEIVINEWTKSAEAPTDGRKYITRSLYDYELSSIVTYYYYWEKNPVTIPTVSFRKNSALIIASIINNPTAEGIVWMSPIDSNISGKRENTLILSNYNNVMTGQEAVLQINMDSDKDVLDHTEWVLVKENTNADIPEFLWTKLKDSLLGEKVIDGTIQPVPSIDLSGRQRLGIGFRPRQTMFDKLYNARENFIDIVNNIFANRTFDQINNDINGWLIKPDSIHKTVVEQPDESMYIDEAETKLEMMSWKDTGLIGNNILVKNDETLDNIWAIYRVNEGWTYTLVDYQKYNLNKYLTLTDWYDNKDVTYLTPTYTINTTSSDAVALCKTLKENQMVKYIAKDNSWELYQLLNNKGLLEVTLVGKSNTLLHIDESIYDYVNDDLDNTAPYIVLEDGTTLTKYQYIYNETQYLLERLIEYFEV